jgi:hypothetical protein
MDRAIGSARPLQSIQSLVNRSPDGELCLIFITFITLLLTSLFMAA